MEENVIDTLNDCRDKLEDISSELCMFAETKRLADRLDRLTRDLDTIIEEVCEQDSEEY